MSSARFFALAERVAAYGGVLTALVQKQQEVPGQIEEVEPSSYEEDTKLDIDMEQSLPMEVLGNG